MSDEQIFHPKCSKCGSSEVTVRYDDGKTTNGEFLACKCQRCEYRWKRITLDQVRLKELESRYDQPPK